MKPKTQKMKSLLQEDSGEAQRAFNEGVMRGVPVKETKRPKFNVNLMEEILDRDNLNKAFKRVKRNKGAAGVDGIKVSELRAQIDKDFPLIRKSLLAGRFKPSPIRRVEIPKPNGGVRKLGIPTVMDRFIQQALTQVLQKSFDPTFSESSFGFRPKRSAHDAINQCKSIQNEDYNFVVDLDLAKFFDEVHHDRLMRKLINLIEDKRVLKLIRRFLQAGVLENGLVSTPDKGTPQGGPLSPLLSNIVLDELDKELELRGHKFVRYADDCNIYVKSERAGLRVMASITKFIETKLRLHVNEEKSSVTKPSRTEFLGFSFVSSKKANTKSRISKKSLKRFKDRIRELTSSRKRIKFSLFIQNLRSYINGWRGYFGKSDCLSIFRSLDEWIRRRVRCLIWQQWRRIKTRVKKLKQLGLRKDLAMTTAVTRKGAWRLSNSPGISMALNVKYLDKIGLPKLHIKL